MKGFILSLLQYNQLISSVFFSNINPQRYDIDIRAAAHGRGEDGGGGAVIYEAIYITLRHTPAYITNRKNGRARCPGHTLLLR